MTSPFGRNPVASVELHVFRGRLFMTGEWGGDWGQALDREISPEELGNMLLRGLQGEHARGRPLIDTLETFQRRDRAEARGWERFCESVAGVSARDYRPEIRVEVLDLSDDVLRVRCIGRAALPGPEQKLPRDVDARTLGQAALHEISGATPQSPTIRRAFVNVASRQRFAVFPSGDVLGAPHVVSMRDGVAALGVAVLTALAESEQPRVTDDEEPDFRSRDEWEDVLRSAGLSSQQLARRRAASVNGLADGRIAVAAWRARSGGGWEPVDVIRDGVLSDRGTAALGRAAPEPLGAAVLIATTTWNPWGDETLAEAVADAP
jgi:hypothetical protein